jgi:putative FmdB family regulatory protein
MPIYEYKCRKCRKEFEMFQGVTDPVVTSCRYCSGPVQKLMSLSSFHLKGSGWYATDYGGEKAPATPAAAEKKASEPKQESTISEKENSIPPSKIKTAG